MTDNSTFEQAIRNYQAVMEERDTLRARLVDAGSDNRVLLDRVERLEQLVNSLSDERDMYMRECTELRSHLISFGAMVSSALAQRGLDPMNVSVQDNGDPPPEFIRRGARKVMGTGGELRAVPEVDQSHETGALRAVAESMGLGRTGK